MTAQVLADGVLDGAMIGLGAAGVTLTYSILRFSNFAHGEMLTAGAYAALTVSGALGSLLAGSAEPIGDTSIGWGLIAATCLAMGFTALLAIVLDWLVFARLGRKATSITVVMASFGASMALRALVEFAFTSSPAYFNRDMQIAVPIGLGMRVTPDQVALTVFSLFLIILTHLVLTRTQVGRSMRAVSENPALARLAGVDVAKVVRITWALGGALATGAGVMLGLLVQIRPGMGFDLLLPMFAAAIVGGIGSVPGAFCGAMIVGLGEALTVAIVGPEWRAALAFCALIAVLLIKPSGLFGARA
ncbi:MAG: branched-chain amino acid ABC transporter permease [Ancalomicrobiaceae bacterium]|nr:branched-chain amino acid ABC transporter permease [Ancalomicrobiaceae bacterium]